MINKILKNLTPLFFLIAFIAIMNIHSGNFLGFYNKPEEPKSKTPTKTIDRFKLKDIKLIFPSAARYKLVAENLAIVEDENGNKIGDALHNLPDCKDIRGFMAPIPMIIGLNSSNQIVGIQLQESQETPSFLDRTINSGILNKWKDLNAKEAIKLNVDAVSGATMSSTCIIKSVTTRLANHLSVNSQNEAENKEKYLTELAAWFFLLIALIAYLPKSPIAKYRKTIQVFSVLIPGILLGRFISLGLLKSWATNGIPYSTQLFMTVLVAMSIFLPMIFGKAFYCAWYCPFGAIQELCGHLCNKKYTPSAKVGAILSEFRPTILFLIILLILFNFTFDIYQLEPFSAFLLKSASTVVLIIAIVSLLLSRFIRRPWCNYFCPTGQFLECCRRKKQ